jgi:hypothetical protein
VEKQEDRWMGWDRMGWMILYKKEEEKKDVSKGLDFHGSRSLCSSRPPSISMLEYERLLLFWLESTMENSASLQRIHSEPSTPPPPKKKIEKTCLYLIPYVPPSRPDVLSTCASISIHALARSFCRCGVPNVPSTIPRSYLRPEGRLY